jgi:hypothetical protein
MNTRHASDAKDQPDRERGNRPSQNETLLRAITSETGFSKGRCDEFCRQTNGRVYADESSLNRFSKTCAFEIEEMIKGGEGHSTMNSVEGTVRTQWRPNAARKGT